MGNKSLKSVPSGARFFSTAASIFLTLGLYSNGVIGSAASPNPIARPTRDSAAAMPKLPIAAIGLRYSLSVICAGAYPSDCPAAAAVL